MCAQYLFKAEPPGPGSSMALNYRHTVPWPCQMELRSVLCSQSANKGPVGILSALPTISPGHIFHENHHHIQASWEEKTWHLIRPKQLLGMSALMTDSRVWQLALIFGCFSVDSPTSRKNEWFGGAIQTTGVSCIY